jgi:predicted N-acyltransferase
MSKLIIGNQVDKNKWKQLLEENEFSSPFQTPDFYHLLNNSKSTSGNVFAVEEEGIYTSLVVVAIQKEKGLKGFFSKRGIIYGGVLTNSSSSLDVLLKGVVSHYKMSLIYLEVRNNFDYSHYKDIYISNKWNFNEHLNVQLKIENKTIDDLLSEMKYNKRREINLSIKNESVTRPAESIKEVEELYNILKDLYITRVKLPIFPLDFFIDLYNSSIGNVIVVVHNNKVIGGAFNVFYKGLSLNTLYYAGLRNYHKKIYPTHLAILGSIEFALENDIKIFDFMGAGKPNIDYGVRDYKLSFGGDLVEHGRFSYILNKPLFKLGKFGLYIMSKF